MLTTSKTRKDSNNKVNKDYLYDLILDVMKVNEELTAREIAVILYTRGNIYSSERQATAPRLTELVGNGKVIVSGKKFDGITKRNVALYSLV